MFKFPKVPTGLEWTNPIMQKVSYAAFRTVTDNGYQLAKETQESGWNSSSLKYARVVPIRHTPCD